ncbi:MFS general substrate transporter [Fistulina hepatica ATCC 64428]|uniref:MFS general substrate transporter n=1 Tax=Fistulina hepatica ATCC 64428 TaxID=1128425 RepID=A0A0D7AE10_9AGAR|nr:MFS general substrate transporter [Fistulina hepatica ATCC 64428]
MLGIVCFMCPGLFNALNGLGAGGQESATTNDNANTALYSTFAFMAFFAGTVNNKLGSKLTLLLGSLGYALYIGSYLALNIHSKAGGFVVAAGAILGICAGLLWTAQGSLMLAYPTEGEKGTYIAIFWSIFNLGGVVGSAVATGQNWDSTRLSDVRRLVGNGTYTAFLILTCIGIFIPMTMANPSSMTRSDGTRVTEPKHPSWIAEFKGLYLTMVTDPMVFLLWPMFFASNWFYTWQFNDYNGAIFTIRARSLNSMIYWMSQIFGSVLISFLLDQGRLSRRSRAFGGWSVLFVMVFVSHGWAYHYQKGYTRDAKYTVDVGDSGYPARLWLYIFFGILDAMWQTTSYWLMGAMSDDVHKLAHLVGMYKSLQSAGAAGVWRADAVKIPYMNIFVSTWALLAVGLLIALPMVYLRVKEHTTIEDEVM